jgi:hypothetical protein
MAQTRSGPGRNILVKVTTSSSSDTQVAYDKYPLDILRMFTNCELLVQTQVGTDTALVCDFNVPTLYRGLKTGLTVVFVGWLLQLPRGGFSPNFKGHPQIPDSVLQGRSLGQLLRMTLMCRSVFMLTMASACS